MKRELACTAVGSSSSRKNPEVMSRRIRKFWEELRKDPVRYAEYMKKRTEAITKAKQVEL